jgi:hypothetical protein
MKKILLLTVIALIFGVINCSAQKKKTVREFRYEVVSMGVGSQGTDLIKVYSYLKNEKELSDITKMNAVHAVLFKGIAATSGTETQPAMVKPKEKENNAEFFEKFFDNGTYNQYVTLSSDGVVNPKDRMKVGKEYKIGIIVSVNKQDLRKYLESEGIIKGLGSMF